MYSLVKAFFPGEEAEVLTQETARDDVTLRVSVFYEDQGIGVTLEKSGQTPVETYRAHAADPARPDKKNVLKDVLYEALSALTGQELPWGDLTGIRPTKLPMAMLAEGKTEEEIFRYLQTSHKVSPARSRLALDVAKAESELVKGIDTDSWSLYIGIPFCPSICLYCTFSSGLLCRWEKRVDEYIDALCKEMDETEKIFRGRELVSIYMGGGTPTTLSALQMDRLLQHLEQTFDLSRVREFTVEAGRPDTITEDKLKVLAAHGINRISINPQSMNQKTLDLIGRAHTVEEIREKFRMARSLGFTNINMDLIVGLPGEDMEEVAHTMDELADLKPDSVTVHSLALKRASRLNQMIEEYRKDSFHSNQALMDMTRQKALDQQLYPYYLYRQKNMAGNFENVGYAGAGKACLYNVLIMEEIHSIAALGASTVSKRVDADGLIERCDNVKDIGLYIERIDEMIDRKRTLYSKYINHSEPSQL